jgi:hypothetical protein
MRAALGTLRGLGSNSASFDYFECARGNGHSFQFFGAKPADIGRVAAGLGLAFGDLTDIVEEHVVVLDVPGCVGHDALEDFAKADDFYFETGFFKDLAEEGLFEEFAGLNGSSWQAPETLERFFATLDQQDAVTIVNQRSNTKDWLGGIAPHIGLNHYSTTAPLTFILAR